MAHANEGIQYFTNQEPGLLSQILQDQLSISGKDFTSLLNLGAIYINNERQIKDKLISENNSFRVHISPRRYSCDFPWSSLVVYENDFCLVLNKPAGIPSHPSIDNFVENSLTQTSLARNFPLYVTHRLDTLTSGLIVYAKKQSFVKSFNAQLQERTIKKKYVALVESSVELPKKLTHFMDPAAGTPKKLTDQATAGWPICELEIISQIQLTPELKWLKLNLLTGRTHQIRAQLSFLHAPIAGDTLYGARLPFKSNAIAPLQSNAIALRSCEIEFSCNGEMMKFSIDEEFHYDRG